MPGATYVAEGRCAQCGGMPEAGRSSCAPCLASNAAAQRRCQARKRAATLGLPSPPEPKQASQDVAWGVRGWEHRERALVKRWAAGFDSGGSPCAPARYEVPTSTGRADIWIADALTVIEAKAGADQFHKAIGQLLSYADDLGAERMQLLLPDHITPNSAWMAKFASHGIEVIHA